MNKVKITLTLETEENLSEWRVDTKENLGEKIILSFEEDPSWIFEHKDLKIKVEVS